jgi:hypothetical protein
MNIDLAASCQRGDYSNASLGVVAVVSGANLGTLDGGASWQRDAIAAQPRPAARPNSVD